MSLPELTEQTRSAHWGWEEHRYFGYRVFAELTGKETLTGLTLLAVLGRRLSPEAAALVDDAACSATLADPRIWPLKLTRVVAAYGSTLPAAAAGLLCLEGARIGPWATVESAQLLIEFQHALGAQADDSDAVNTLVRAHLDAHRFIWGFGTPFRKHDERLVAFRECVERRGRTELPFWRLMNSVSKSVSQARGAEPNMGVALAAAFLDLGLTPHQIGALTCALMQHMFLAHAVEASATTSLLRELPADYVQFSGSAPRVSPRALGQST